MSWMREGRSSYLECDGQPVRLPKEPMPKPLPLPSESTVGFGPVETSFFQEGDDLSTDGMAAEGWDEPTVVCRRHRKLRKRTALVLMAATAVGACTTFAMSRMEASPRSVPPSTPALPSPVPPPCFAAATPQEPPPSPSSATATVRNPSPPPSPATAPAIPYPLSTPSPIAAGAVAVPIDDTSLAACKQAYDQRRTKEVVAACTEAFAAHPECAEVALMLAKTEFERGRSRPAFGWASRAIALDDSLADAYVFLGGAEQALGHIAKAKTAYKRYLELSPRGHYAADLRAVLGSL